MELKEERIIHRFINNIADYELNGKYYNQVIPTDTQAYALYPVGSTKAGLWCVYGDGIHTYTEIRDGQSAKQSSKEYPVFSNEYVALINSKADNAEMQAALESLDTLKADKADTYTKAEVDAKISTVFRYKGTVAKVSDLPKTGNKIGDVYNVLSTGSNYAWDGEQWDKLSETVDLTPYLTKVEAANTYETIANVNKVVSDLASEVTRATNAESVLTTNLSTEVTRASNAEEALTSQLLTEVTRATTAESTLNNTLTSEIQRSTQADETLTSQLTSEINRATTAEGTLTSNLTTEVTRATQAETTIASDLSTHVTNKENPHNVTKAQLGLDQVDNTADLDKPISTVTQEALDKKEDKINGYDTIKREKAYLYTTTYSDLDYDFAKKHFENLKVINLGACSTVRNKNFVGRNFDWFYNENATFVVKTPRNGNKYATIGVACSIPGLDEDFVSSGEYSENYKLVPFYLLDGINEYGLTASNLVVPAQKGITTASIPAVEKREEISFLMLIRYIIENFKTAKEAAEYIRDYVSVYTLKALYNVSYELHYMISDRNKTYSIEFINKIAVIKDITSKPYMTNFYLDGVSFLKEETAGIPEGGVYTPATVNAGYLPSSLGLTTHADGLERYNLIVEHYDTLDRKENMQDFMFNADYSIPSLRYTKAYRAATNPYWNTEFAGDWEWSDDDGHHEWHLTVDSPEEDYAEVKEYVRGFYERDIRDGKTWQTTHSSVYDLDKNILYIKTQEDNIEYVYNFDYYTKEEIDAKLFWEKGTCQYSIQTRNTQAEAIGDYSIAEGFSTTARGFGSHAEGEATHATGEGAHAEGAGTVASGKQSHAEGSSSTATGNRAHAEGIECYASGVGSHAEGDHTLVSQRAEVAHAEGDHTVADNIAEHAEGRFNRSNHNDESEGFGDAGNTLHSIGIGTGSDIDKRKNAVEVMQNGDTYIIGVGNYDGTNVSEANTAQNVLNGKQDTLVSGTNIKTINNNSVLGSGNIEIKTNWQDGEGTNAIVTKANASTGGTANADFSVSEGQQTKVFATAIGAHAEGIGSLARGAASHVEGQQSETTGACSHAEGGMTTAVADFSHAEGNSTIANNLYEHAEGHFNLSNKASEIYGDAGNTIHSIGIGTNLTNRKNATEVMQNGDMYVIGVGGYDGTNYDDANTLQNSIAAMPIIAAEAPSITTEGKLGQLYINTAGQMAYICVSVNNTKHEYVWKVITLGD